VYLKQGLYYFMKFALTACTQNH